MVRVYALGTLEGSRPSLVYECKCGSKHSSGTCRIVSTQSPLSVVPAARLPDPVTLPSAPNTSSASLVPHLDTCLPTHLPRPPGKYPLGLWALTVAVLLLRRTYIKGTQTKWNPRKQRYPNLAGRVPSQRKAIPLNPLHNQKYR